MTISASVFPAGAEVRFAAADDEELWGKFHEFFDGQWESDYCSIGDFLEDHGLELS